MKRAWQGGGQDQAVVPYKKTPVPVVNDTKIFVFHRIEVTVKVQNIRNRCDMLSIKEQNPSLYDYVINHSPSDKFQELECVVLLSHPMDDVTGALDTTRRIAVFCLGVAYTIYKRVDDMDDDDEEQQNAVNKKIAVRNAYNLSTRCYDEHKFVSVKSFSYWAAQDKVAKAKEEEGGDEYYNNRHTVLQEFTYQCNARFICFKCRVKKTDMKCILCGNHYVCIDCHDHSLLNDEAIKTINQSQMLRYKQIPAIKPLPFLTMNQGSGRKGFFLFCDGKNVDEEVVTAIRPGDLPWDEPTTEEDIIMEDGYSIKVY